MRNLIILAVLLIACSALGGDVDAVKLVCENFDDSNLVVNDVIKYEKQK